MRLHAHPIPLRSVWIQLVCVLLTALMPSLSRADSHPPPSPMPAPDATQPRLDVTLSEPLYHIAVDAKSGVPRMPRNVVASVHPQNWPAGTPLPKTFLWHVMLDWEFKPFPTHHTINTKLYTHTSPWKIDFGPELRGGILTVFAKTQCNGREVWGKTKAEVVGDNPQRAQVLQAFPRTRFGLIASKIGMAESGLRQFTRTEGLIPGGQPVVSRTNDVGIMQLNAPSGTVQSADEIWDWRENVKRGLLVLEGKQRTTVLAYRHGGPTERTSGPPPDTLACLHLLRWCVGLPPFEPTPTPTLSDQPGSGTLSDDPDGDHVYLSQMERDTIRRYNGGREYALTPTTDPMFPGLRVNRWQVDPTRGGIRSGSGDADYVRHVLAAHSGLDLTPPPPPKKPHAPTRRRRHHRR